MHKFKVVRDDDYYELQATGLKPKTPLEAIQLSVEKWKFIVEWAERHPDEQLDDGAGDTCACCIYTGEIDTEPTTLRDCRGCPVREVTGVGNCANTPYWSVGQKKGPDGFLEGAREELEFLEGILEAEEAKRDS
jgi:hypothetical protein